MKPTRILFLLALLLLTGLSAAQIRIHAKSPVGVLSMKVVQTDLKLTEAQITVIKKVQDDFRATINGLMSGGLTGGSAEELQAQIDSESTKLEKQVLDSLTAPQKERLSELELQLGPPSTILNEGYAKTLNLTADQKSKIKTLNQDYLDQLGDLQQSGITDPDELTIKRGKIRKSTIESIEVILTAAQRETLTKLRGVLVKI